MEQTLKTSILEKLRSVRGPNLKDDIVSLGLVSDLHLRNGTVAFSITVPESDAANLEPLRQAAEKMASEVEGVQKALVTLTAEKKENSPPRSPVRPAPTPEQSQSVPPPMMARQGQDAPKIQNENIAKAIVAVASGKGGVGKSTTSVNLALALQSLGLSVGVLDADIYGPSMPRLLRLTGRPEAISGKILKPLDGYGLKVMSIGFLVEEDTPMIWRGPMVISAITQMLKDVAWDNPDVLIVDMPPGTGDAQLTMAQQVPLAGSVIVSTPQDLALIDARKGINMFRRVDVPILGIVENMSTFICPSCGHQTNIFGNGGAKAEADRIGVPFLGGIPLHIDIREQSDAGMPIVISDPESLHAKTYISIAEMLWQRLEKEQNLSERKAPNIVIE